MSKTGKRLLAAVQELLEAVRNDSWTTRVLPSGVVVKTAKPIKKSKRSKK